MQARLQCQRAVQFHNASHLFARTIQRLVSNLQVPS